MEQPYANRSGCFRDEAPDESECDMPLRESLLTTWSLPAMRLVSVSLPPPGFGDRAGARGDTLALFQPRLSWTIALPTIPNAASTNGSTFALALNAGADGVAKTNCALCANHWLLMPW